jgi:hypothetical protein
MISDETYNEARRAVKEPMTDGGLASLEQTDSAVTITLGAEERVEEETRNGTIAVLRDVKVEKRRHLNRNFINFEHWFQPPADLFYDHANEQEIGEGVQHIDFRDYEFTFEIYEDELETAIQMRAMEENATFEKVAAEWANLAESADHVPDDVVRTLRGMA